MAQRAACWSAEHMNWACTTVTMARTLESYVPVCAVSLCMYTTSVSMYVHTLLPVVEESLCPNGDVRIVDGNSNSDGRVEICLDGEWGTVCADRHWDEEDARTTCRQLEFDDEGNL